ncbi:ABC transporter ATP-binding protein [Flavobacterium psychraquaticum]|uniref:ABC transporter ATP-binding protein n=1 Tax=Flavobacterium psychraquaticum TaxID=3103958 RepID=UPI002ACE2965|nr:ATP-binding cassette domain-containing protein [Flavobacterium sp. LB-N7T]
MINTKNIKFSYLKEQEFIFPDLHCEAGNTLLITGDSGRGKTTYLHILAGLLKPKSGEIQIDTTDVLALSEKETDKFRGKNIGVVFQKSYFIAALTILENLEMASWLATGKKNTDRAKKLLQQLGIENQCPKLPSQLSIGQQQRVSIARALMNEPKVLLADEPTSSLDDKNAEKVIELLTFLSKEYKAALLIVTHDSRIKEKFTNKITLV